MLKKLDGIRKLLATGSAAAFGFASDQILKMLLAALGSPTLAKIALVMLMFVLFYLVDSLVGWIINESPTLRRVVLRGHDIEGWWIDKVFVDKDNEPDNFGFMQIAYVDGQYQVNGRSYSCSGDLEGTFQCYISEYSNFKLMYAYRGVNRRVPRVSLEGYGEYHFCPGEKRVNDFVGYIYDTNHGARVSLVGKRLDDLYSAEDIDVRSKRVEMMSLFKNDLLAKSQRKSFVEWLRRITIRIWTPPTSRGCAEFCVNGISVYA